MPRKRRRFSQLNRSLKDNKGVVGGDGRLAKYVDFITGKTDFNISSTALEAIKGAGGRSGSFGVGLKPFNIEAPTDAAANYFASFTKYSKSVLAPLNLQAEAGHITIVTNTSKTIDDYTYNPAILIAHIRTSTEVTTPTSQITGKSYKRYAGKSGTIPFGCKTAYGEKEDVRKKELMSAAKSGANGAYTVTYQPEEWNAPRTRMRPV